MNNNYGMLEKLPMPPSDKLGWPWTVETLPQIYFKGYYYPKISVITPSYNQGNFIEETIRSVILQNYPNLELIIIDGGSTDNTIEILNKYDLWISYWVSEKDNGQSNAINKGLKIATGQLIGWQNSDDIYFPNAFYEIVKAFNKDRKSSIYFGHQAKINYKSNITHINYFVPFKLFHLKSYGWNIVNQSAFFNKESKIEIILDDKLTYAMDLDLFLKAASTDNNFQFINKIIGALRDHENTKSSLFTYDNKYLEYQYLYIKYFGVKLKKGVSLKRQFPLQSFIAFTRLLILHIYYGNICPIIKQKIKTIHL